MFESPILVGILGLASFCFVLAFTRKKEITISVTRFARLSSFFVFLLWLFSIISFILVPTYNEFSFLSWNELGTFYLATSFLSYGLALFWPGFIITLPLHSQLKLSSIERVFLSFVVSLGSFLLVTYASALVSPFYSTGFTLGLLLIGNIIGILCYSVTIVRRTIRSERATDHNETLDIEIFSKLGLLLTICYAIVGVLFIQTSFTYSLYGDMLSHHGYALELFHGGQLAGRSAYYPWYQSLLATIFGLGSVPTLNSFVLVSIAFPFFYVTGFYVFARALLRKASPIPELATYVFITFGGLEWIIGIVRFLEGITNPSILISQVSKETIYGIIYSGFSNIYYFMPMMIGYLSLFGMLFVILRSNETGFGRHIYPLLIFSLLALAALLYHGPEFLYFEVIIAGIFIIRENRRFFIATQLTTIGAVVIAIIFVLSISMPVIALYQYALLGCAAVTICVLLLQSVKRKPIIQKLRTSLHLDSIGRTMLPAVILTGLLVYFINMPFQFPTLAFYYEIIPWYLYPLRLGIALLLFGAFILLNWFSHKRIKELVLVFILFLLFAKFSTFLNIIQIAGYFEARILTPLLMILALISPFIFERLVHLEFKYKKAAILGIFVLLLCGPVTTVVQVQYWSIVGRNSYTNVPSDVIDGLQYLRSNVAPQENIMVIQEKYFPMVLGMTQARTTPMSWFTYGSLRNQAKLIDFSDPMTMLLVLSSYDVHYIFSDTMMSEIDNKSALNEILPFLPIAFSNELIVIYSVPPLVEPMTDRNVHFLTPRNSWDMELDYLMNSHFFGDLKWSEMLNGWTNTEDGEIELSSDYIIGPASLKLRTNSSCNFWRTIPPVNITDGSLLQFYLKSASSSLMVRIGSSSSDFYYTYVDTTFDEFHLTTVQLGNSSSLRSQGNPTWSDISYLEFHLIGTPGEVIIDGLTLVPAIEIGSPLNRSRLAELMLGFQVSNVSSHYRPNYNSWDEQDVLVLIHDSKDTLNLNMSSPAVSRWIEDGGSVLVFGNGIDGYFFDSLNLTSNGLVASDGLIHSDQVFHLPLIATVPNFAFSDYGVQIMANYSLDASSVAPAIVTKTIGSGRIVYVSYDPMLNMWRESQHKSELIDILQSTLYTLVKPSEQELHSLSDKMSKMAQGIRINAGLTRGPIQLGSPFSIKASRCYFGNQIEVSQLVISESSGLNTTIENTTIQSMTLIGLEEVILDYDGFGTICGTDQLELSVISGRGSMHATASLSNSGALDITYVMNDSEVTHSFTQISSLELWFELPKPILVGCPRVYSQGGANLTNSYVFEQVVQSLSAREGDPLALGTYANFSIASLGGVSFLTDLELEIPEDEMITDNWVEWIELELLLDRGATWFIPLLAIPTTMIIVGAVIWKREQITN